MWSLIIDMISAESTELDSKVICGAEDNHKDSGNKSYTKNEECDKASKSDKGNVTRDNTGSPEKQENEEQLEPDCEAGKVNLKHQIEDERKSAEEWMLDYALQKTTGKGNTSVSNEDNVREHVDKECRR
ncbi:hypothetical protein RDI58_017820 [Solanum bulbocastanum]|uniref:Calmodulin-binding domain-containing protein n=1 Tax=Solanum bulbocastanum TaxID=147425 RepID=A0AAN8TBZ5_SOLBU